MKKFRMTIAAVLSVVISGVFYVAPVKAAMFETASVTLSEPRVSLDSDYSFSVKAATDLKVKGIKMEFLKAPSGAGAVAPASFTFGNAHIGTGFQGLSEAAWTLDATTNDENGIIYLTSVAGQDVTDNMSLGWNIHSISNGTITNQAGTGCTQNATNASAGACYIKVTTFITDSVVDMLAAAPENIADTITVGFSIYAGGTMTATVDPTLEFTVAGVNQGVDVADADTATTTTARSEFDTLAYGNVTPGTPEVMSQTLKVRTNANGGYNVKVKSMTNAVNADGVMNGIYNNDIDMFSGNDNDATFLAPHVWEEPTSQTINVNSGFLGVNSTDTDTVFSAGNELLWAPLENANWNLIMAKNGPDLGTAAVTVSFALEVDVYQPADTYTGQFAYSCVPIY